MVRGKQGARHPQPEPEENRPHLEDENQPRIRERLRDDGDNERDDTGQEDEKTADTVKDEYQPSYSIEHEPGSVWPLAFFSIIVIGYFILAISSINEKYVDFGDGNYLYISWRVMEGETLYEDLPSPQPPLLLLMGSSLLGLAGGDPIFLRLWQVIQHALTACCIVAIGHRIFKFNAMAYLAGMIYIFLPEGVWWAMGYQSEPLLILLQSLNLLLLLSALQAGKPTKTLYLAGFVSSLCCYVNMTALPYVLLQWFFVWFHFKPFFKGYTISFLAPLAALFAIFYVYSGGQYIEHVFFRQVGTYPTHSFEGMVGYFISKLVTEGGDILHWEGGFVFASMAGILLYAGDQSNQAYRPKAYLIWWGVFSLGSIIFVTKGGTVEYIFTLGEPAVALFASYFICSFFWATGVETKAKTAFRSPIELGKWVLLICLVVPALTMKPIELLTYTFSNSSAVYELSHDEMQRVRALIEQKTDEDDLILAPPYYAFHAQRKLAGNMSSLFILLHAYYTEWDALREKRDLPFDLPGVQDPIPTNPLQPHYEPSAILELAALFSREPGLGEDYPAIQLFLDVRQQILDGKVPLILANKNHAFFKVPPLDDAIRRGCIRSDVQLNLRTREENIIVYEAR